MSIFLKIILPSKDFDTLLADIVNYDFNTKNFKVSIFDEETVQMQVTQ